MKNKPVASHTISCVSIADKTIKFVQSKGGVISSLQVITLAHRSDEEIGKGLDELFKDKKQKDLGMFILSLPRQIAALHYVRLPSHNPLEIREMARLQASKQLPYEPQAIVLGHQIIRESPDGYADVLLAIVHQDIIKKYLRLLEKNRLEPMEITIDSQGVSRWLKLQSGIDVTQTVAVVELDASYVRLDIVASDALIYSRAFSLTVPAAEYKSKLTEEINKSISAYEKESIGIQPEIMIFTGAEELVSIIDDTLSLQVPFKYIKRSQSQGIQFKSGVALRQGELAKNSFAGLLGMVLSRDALSFNLLPEDTLTKRHKISYARQLYTAAVYVCLIIVIIGAGMFLSFSARKKIIERRTTELSFLSGDVGQIEKKAKKLNYVRNQLAQSNICLDALAEVFRIAPSDIHLVFFGYDNDKPVILKGQAKTLSMVFTFVNNLEASTLFKEVQVRHSSKRKVKDEEVADFEIICPIESL